MALIKKILENKGYTITQENEKTIAFTGQGYYNRGSFNRETGAVTMTARADMSWLKPTYTREFVQQKVRKFGWTVKAISDTKFQVIKR